MTVREAVLKFAAESEKRVGMVTSLGIEDTTNETLIRRLHGAFGQSSNIQNPPLRSTPIDIDAPLVSIDKQRLSEFAHYWHGGPDGINSERTIKNHLEAARQFLSGARNRTSTVGTCQRPVGGS